MKILSNRVMIKLDEPNNVSKAGIIIHKSWEDARNTGIVLDTSMAVTSVHKDDHVQINPYAVLETPDKDVVFVREDDILAVL